MIASPMPTPEALAATAEAKRAAERRRDRSPKAPPVKPSPGGKLPPMTCGTCTRTPSQMQSIQAERFECSHVDCPNRRALTAAPCDVPPLGWYHMGVDD